MSDHQSSISKAIGAWKRWRDLNHNRQIFAAAVSVGLVSLLVKISFVVKELIIAYQFGRADALDAYVIAYALPAFLINVIASVYGSAFVPVFLRAWTQRGQAQAQQLLSGALLGNLIVLILVCVALWGLGMPLMKALGSGFTSEKLTLTHQLFTLFVPAILLGGLVATVAAVLNANEKFYAPALSPLFTSVAITVALFLFSKAWGVYALVIGTLLGLCLELIYLARKAAQLNWRLRPGWQWNSQDRQQLMSQFAPLAGGALLMSSLDLVDNSMASMLSPGSVSVLSYGTRISLAVIGLSSVALGTVVLPRFSRLAAAEEWQEIKKILQTYNRLIVMVSAPVVTAMVVFSDDLVAIIYQRGAFTTDDTRLVSQVQMMYVLQMPFYLMGILGGRVISAGGKNQWLMVIAAVSVVLNIVGNYALMNVFGVAGIALATTTVIFLSWLMVQLLASRMIKQNLIERRESAGSSPIQ
jgi:putative peptidoglycan lipid II flippase